MAKGTRKESRKRLKRLKELGKKGYAPTTAGKVKIGKKYMKKRKGESDVAYQKRKLKEAGI